MYYLHRAEEVYDRIIAFKFLFCDFYPPQANLCCWPFRVCGGSAMLVSFLTFIRSFG